MEMTSSSTEAASAIGERRRGCGGHAPGSPFSVEIGVDTTASKAWQDEWRSRLRPLSDLTTPPRVGTLPRREGGRSGSSPSSRRSLRRRRRMEAALPTAVGGGSTWSFLAFAAAMIRLQPDSTGAVPGTLVTATITEARQRQYGRGRPSTNVNEDDPAWGGFSARGGGIAATPRHPRGDRPPNHPIGGVGGGGRRRLQGDAADGAVLPPPATDGGGESQRLRRDLLESYDRGSYPWEYAWAQSGWVPPSSSDNATTSDSNGSINATDKDSGGVIRRGLPVEIGINFHRVYLINVVASDADLIVWLRQRWVDPRLSWNPDDYSGLTTVWFYIGDGVGAGETSEIWTPDVELWNMGVSLKESLTDAYATVDHTGTVFWSRPGHLKPVCKFTGLDSFPFDTLGCTMEIGSWSKSGLYLRPTRMGGTGYSVGGSETAGESYAEFTLKSVDCREHIYPPYIGLQEEDWPVLLYDVSFTRSWQPYTRGYLTLQIVLNLAGFACFWMPVQSGERVALAITAMLAAVASELVVSARIPSAAEVTWFQAFSLASLAFASLCLFESVAVVYFFYYTHADLVPDWCRWISNKLLRRGSVDAKDAGALGRRTGLDHCGAPSRGGVNQVQSSGIISELPSIDESDEDVGGDGDNEESSDNGNGGKDECFGEASSDTGASTTSSNGSANGGSGGSATSSRGHGDRGGRLLSPPRPRAESRSPGRPPSLLAGTGVAVSPSPTRRKGGMMRSNSVARDADDFHDASDAENNRRWQRVAARIDDGARVVIPLAYAVVVGVLLTRVSYT